MRTKSCKNRNYTSKGKATKLNGQKDDKITDNENENVSEPQPMLQNAAYEIEIASAKKWYELFNIAYYEHLEATYHISWSDTLDKNGNILLETQVKVALPNDVHSKMKGVEDPDKTIYNKCIPTKNYVLYTLTLYHTINTILIQGNKKQMWVDKEYPILRTVRKRMKEQDLTILDVCNQVLNLPSKDDHHHKTISIPLSMSQQEK